MRFWLVVSNDELQKPLSKPMTIKEIASYFYISEKALISRMSFRYWDNHPEEKERAIHLCKYKDKVKYKELFIKNDL